MNDSLLDIWEITCPSDTKSMVIPDGCRDVLVKIKAGERPHFSISTLQFQTKVVAINAGTTIIGFRMQPGAQFDVKDILNSVPKNFSDAVELADRLQDHIYLAHSIKNALQCLASPVHTVSEAANEIGVSPRTLQRLLLKETGRSPIFWLMLARVRKSARALIGQMSLADIADQYGYADQAHMCREFRRWFDISPSQLRKSSALLNQLGHLAYA